MFGVTDYSAFVVAVMVFLCIPGPGNLVLIISTSTGGKRAGSAAAVGVIGGDQVLIWLAVFGVAALLKAWPFAFGALQSLGAAYLVWMGFCMIVAKVGDASTCNFQPRRYFQQAFTTTVLNPKAIIFYMAFFPLFIDPTRQQGLVTLAFMAITVVGLTSLYAAVVVLLTHNLADRVRTSPRTNRALNRVAGIFLISFGVKLVLSR